MTAPTSPSTPRRRFAFISSNPSWGGSEELWSAAAVALAQDGHRVSVFIVQRHKAPRMDCLDALSVPVTELQSLPLVPRKVMGLVARIANPVAVRVRSLRLELGLIFGPRPDLVIVSQGGNFDGARLAAVCRRRGLAYVLLSQKAQDTRWPPDSMIDEVAGVYGDARRAFFVSEHNRRLTEEQIGAALPRAVVVRNPYLVPPNGTAPWPSDAGGTRLACVGRLYPFDKGQDLILRVLARPHWRARPISVDFYGDGVQRRGLERMAAFLGLSSVSFKGSVSDIPAIWLTHHALLLPSRAEGLPLVLVEAMMSGRPAIVTDVAGNAEVLTDEETGFIAATPTEDALDEAMERAWRRRDDWAAMGLRAAAAIRDKVPENPARAFADALLAEVEGPTA